MEAAGVESSRNLTLLPSEAFRPPSMSHMTHRAGARVVVGCSHWAAVSLRCLLHRAEQRWLCGKLYTLAAVSLRELSDEGIGPTTKSNDPLPELGLW